MAFGNVDEQRKSGREREEGRKENKEIERGRERGVGVMKLQAKVRLICTILAEPTFNTKKKEMLIKSGYVCNPLTIHPRTANQKLYLLQTKEY